jgi:hypothetical protein
MAEWLVGVDIGGTFTDLIAVDQRARQAAVAVHCTTRAMPAPPIRQGPCRRRVPSVLAAGFASVVLIGLAVTHLPSGGDAVVGTSGPTPHYAPSWLPDRFERWAATDAQAISPSAFPAAFTVVWDHRVPNPLQAPAAMVFTTPARPDISLRSFVPGGPTVKSVTVQGVEGLTYADGGQRQVVIFGPLAGTVVTVEASGLDPGDVLRLAETVRVVDGREQIDLAAAGARFAAAEVNFPTAQYLLTGGSGGPVPAVLYIDGPAPGNDAVTVMVSEPVEGIAPFLRISLGDATQTEVAGATGVMGEYLGLNWLFGGPHTVVAVALVDDRLVVVSAEGVTREDTRRLAASLRPVSDDQWRSWVATPTPPAPAPQATPGVDYSDAPRTHTDSTGR